MKNNKQIGYLGPEGTFSHEAVLKIVDNQTMIKPYANIIDIFK